MNKHGFTLTELLIVIAVISILTAMLLPALSGSRATATGMKCLSNIRELSRIFTMYSDDYDDCFPCLDTIGAGSINRYGKSINAKNWLDDLVSDSLEQTRPQLIQRNFCAVRWRPQPKTSQPTMV